MSIPPTPPIGRPHLFVSPNSAATHLAREWLRSQLEFGSDVDEYEQLIAVSEIVQNACDAHRTASIDRLVDITLSGPPLVVTVTDDAGVGFDPGLAGRALPDVSSISGRGLLVAHALLPDIRFESHAQGTRVVLPLRPTTTLR